MYLSFEIPDDWNCNEFLNKRLDVINFTLILRQAFSKKTQNFKNHTSLFVSTNLSAMFQSERLTFISAVTEVQFTLPYLIAENVFT